jgi:ABC-type Fe3+-hydroxamate transport system substrate-binding protein
MRIKSLFSLVLIIAILSSILVGCSGKGKTDENGNVIQTMSNYPVTVKDITFKESPATIVLSPSIADIMITQKLTGKLIGRSDDCDQKTISNLTSVGNSSNPDIDSIKSLSPRLIISDTPLPEDKAEIIKSNSIDILVLPNAANRDEFIKLYTNIGSIFAGAKDGYIYSKEKAGSILRTIDGINALIPPSDTYPTACYLYSATGKAVTGDNFANDLIAASGATNAAINMVNGNFSIEDLRAANPSYIFCVPDVQDLLMNDPTYSGLTAVSQQRVFAMNPVLISRQGGTSVVETVTFMAGAMYPNLNNNINKDSSETVSSQPNVSSVAVTSETPSQAASQQPATLKLGDSGPDVMRMQARLKELGQTYKDPTGTFDEVTEQGVKNFQYLSKMSVTGIADENTLNKLYSPDAVTGPDYKG